MVIVNKWSISHFNKHDSTILPMVSPFVISYRAKVQDFLLVSPITINEVCGDYHVVQVLYRGPSIRCHTKSLPNKSPSQNIHLTRINFHTSPYNSTMTGNRKPRLNYLHKFLKALTLHKFKMYFITDDHPFQHHPYPLFIIVCNH